jgi:hypothetical protein
MPDPVPQIGHQHCPAAAVKCGSTLGDTICCHAPVAAHVRPASPVVGVADDSMRPQQLQREAGDRAAADFHAPVSIPQVPSGRTVATAVQAHHDRSPCHTDAGNGQEQRTHGCTRCHGASCQLRSCERACCSQARGARCSCDGAAVLELQLPAAANHWCSCNWLPTVASHAAVRVLAGSTCASDQCVTTLQPV